MKVKIVCFECKGEKYVYKDIFTKCVNCITYMYSGLQPPFCSEDVVGCNKISKITCEKCKGIGTIIVDGDKVD